MGASGGFIVGFVVGFLLFFIKCCWGWFLRVWGCEGGVYVRIFMKDGKYALKFCFLDDQIR